MNTQPSSVLLTGLPGSGKTTFIAALWWLVTESSGTLALKVSALPEDAEHLNGIMGTWLRLKRQEHTSAGNERESALSFQGSTPGEIRTFVVPDLAGDNVREAISARAWQGTFDVLVASASGIMLFVHPRVIHVDLIGDVPALVDLAANESPDELAEIEDARDAMESSQEEVPEEATSESTPAMNREAWSPADMPTDAQLVDLVQLFLSRRVGRTRIALIVSAWDLIAGHDGAEASDAPKEWLRRTLPLLTQALETNADDLEHRVYGISAQGGDFGDPAEVERLSGLLRPLERIIAIGPDCEPHDLSAPLKWIGGFA